MGGICFASLTPILPPPKSDFWIRPCSSLQPSQVLHLPLPTTHGKKQKRLLYIELYLPAGSWIRDKYIEIEKTRSKGASLLKWFQTVKAARHYLLDIPDVRRNHTLLFFSLKIISVREIYSDSLFQPAGVQDVQPYYTRRTGRDSLFQIQNLFWPVPTFSLLNRAIRYVPKESKYVSIGIISLCIKLTDIPSIPFLINSPCFIHSIPKRIIQFIKQTSTSQIL